MSQSEAKKRIIERQRKAAHLHYNDYLPIRQIAEELHVNEKTIDRDLKSRVARGVKGYGTLLTRRFNEDLRERFRERTEHLTLETRYILLSKLWMMSEEEQFREVLRISYGGDAK